MSSATFKLSAFGDEIASDLGEQLQLLKELNVGHLEIRNAWGKNIVAMDDNEVARAKAACDEYGIGVSAIGSPIGKSPIDEPIENELATLERVCQIGEILETRSVRIFSFYPPDTSTNDHYDDYVDASISRLGKLAELAQREGATLYLENEKEIVGDTIARCHTIMKEVASPHLRFAWDPANFVQVEGGGITDRGWDVLSEYTSYVHIKDVRASDGRVVGAGEGDGQVEELLTNLKASGYQGFLALEPHLAIAGHSSGFSGVDGMTYAVKKLRELMRKVGCQEV